MRRAIATLIAGVLATSAGLTQVACSSSSSSSSSGGTGEDGGSSGSSGSSGSGGDGGSSGDGGSQADSAAVDAGPVNGCKMFDDRTAAGATRTITWGFPLSAADRCIEIKVGQSVTWSGNFTQYRVGPSGGDKPSPIAAFDPDAPTLKFPTAGTFGFESPDAPALVGAILVSP